MNIKEVKIEAKNSLQGNWGTAIGGFIVLGLIGFAMSMVTNMISGVGSIAGGLAGANSGNISEADLIAMTSVMIGTMSVSFVLGIITQIISSVLDVGYKWSFLDLVDGKNYSIGSIFQVFNKNFFKVLGLIIMIGIFTALWSLLLVVPGIIKSYSYSQALNIMKDNPEIGILDAITASRKLMDGKKANFFFLQLSFILWYIVPLIIWLVVFFIGISGWDNGTSPLVVTSIILAFVLALYFIAISFYITPYLKTSEQVYYRRLTVQQLGE